MNKHIVLLLAGLSLSSLSFANNAQPTEEEIKQMVDKQVTALKKFYDEADPAKQKEFFELFLANRSQAEFYENKFHEASKHLKTTKEELKEHAEELNAERNYGRLMGFATLAGIVGCTFLGYKWIAANNKCIALQITQEHINNYVAQAQTVLSELGRTRRVTFALKKIKNLKK